MSVDRPQPLEPPIPCLGTTRSQPGLPSPSGLRAIKLFAQLRPVRTSDAFRLAAAFVGSMVMRLIAPRRFTSAGFLLPGTSRVLVSLRGVRFWIRPGTDDLALVATTHEPNTATWFHFETSDVFVDVGAHIGRYALEAAASGSRVIAVEPEPSNLTMLRDNIALNGFRNVQAYDVAVSDSTGRRTFYLTKGGDTGASSLEKSWRAYFAGTDMVSRLEVKVDTLDHLLEDAGVEKVDWLKIDVEGHEVPVLVGARRTLTRTENVVLEVSSRNQRECREIIEAAGFQIVAAETIGSTTNWHLEKKIPA
jgi:FkbM family methyltransferase